MSTDALTTCNTAACTPTTTQPARRYTPRIDIWESPEAFHLEAVMPGVDAEHVEIQLEDDVLTIAGDGVRSEHGKPVYREHAAGCYHRALRLANTVDAAKIAASMRNGVLTVTLPKAEAARPRKIAVDAA
jgi:HSP20 family molecular chaperone IbpA